jgi:hypothetical protein
MILSWFDARAAVDFGHDLADFYDKQSKLNARASNQKIADKQQKLVAQLLLKARQFNAEKKLNAYQKAKLGNAFKWKLHDMGHDAGLVDVMTRDIMFALR